MEGRVFDSTYVINLDRRPERWQAFCESWPHDWPYSPPVRVSAVDSQLCPAPSWWTPGQGAWGCLRSHLMLIEQSLNRGDNCVLILEDDAVPCEDFLPRLRSYLEALPDDWGMAYLGGQLLYEKTHPPVRVNEWCYRPFNVNRTHAYALRGETMRRVYQHLCAKDWARAHHVDHHLGKYHGKNVGVYCPREWLLGQREGKSDISSKAWDQPRFWEPSSSVGSLAPVVVLGLHRSGSSCLAGVLHALGIYMGKDFRGCEPGGGHEDRELARLCETAMPFPKTQLRVSEHVLKNRFLNWCRLRVKESRGKPIGAKYPHLCAMTSVIPSDARIVHAYRPLDESIESLVLRSGKKFSPERLEELQRFLWARKESFLAVREDTFTVSYDEILHDPERVITALAGWLGVPVTQEAIDFVRPGLRRITRTS